MRGVMGLVILFRARRWVLSRLDFKVLAVFRFWADGVLGFEREGMVGCWVFLKGSLEVRRSTQLRWKSRGLSGERFAKGICSGKKEMQLSAVLVRLGEN